MANLTALKTEIDTDPLTRGYAGMTDAQVAADINTVNRPDTVSIEEVLKFLILDNVHSTNGNDTQDRSLWQRMKEVVSLAEVPTSGTADPWGSTEIGNVSEIQQAKTHTLFDFFTLSAQGSLPVDLTNSNFKVYLAGAQAAGCMSTAQETALLALSDNLQSRAQELVLGKVRTADVTAARA